ncbi:hypothetical protein KY290_001878 [Solanum tuberosum]|uniref:Uncharacterized protein n=1 Tax=Solanum tuberosum TaxID=4113 RepID=A0ABQ7WQQ1_SOLTU|nr:hypothetical protein KY290_001878 [Solanum tuberosum]
MDHKSSLELHEKEDKPIMLFHNTFIFLTASQMNQHPGRGNWPSQELAPVGHVSIMSLKNSHIHRVSNSTVEGSMQMTSKAT